MHRTFQVVVICEVTIDTTSFEENKIILVFIFLRKIKTPVLYRKYYYYLPLNTYYIDLCGAFHYFTIYIII